MMGLVFVRAAAGAVLVLFAAAIAPRTLGQTSTSTAPASSAAPPNTSAPSVVAPSVVIPSGPLASSPSAAPSADAPVASRAADVSNRVAGKTFRWSLAVSGNPQRCEEQWSFSEDRIMTIVSGDEVTTHRFTLLSVPGQPYVLLSRTRLTSNGRPDCAGQSDPRTGQNRQMYFLFLNGGGFFTCAATADRSCFGTASETTAAPAAPAPATPAPTLPPLQLRP